MEDCWVSLREHATRYFRSHVNDGDAVDELTQEVCTRAWISHTQGRVSELGRAWIIAISWHVLVDYFRAIAAWRANRRRQPIRHGKVTGMVVVGESCPFMHEIRYVPRVREFFIAERRVELHHLLSHLDDAISQLPDSWRAIMRERQEGRSMMQIATSLGLSMNVVRMRLHRGRGHLKSVIEKRIREEDENDLREIGY